jgi:hypothetical protein
MTHHNKGLFLLFINTDDKPAIIMGLSSVLL